MAKCVIKREDRPGLMLQGLGIGGFANNCREQIEWTQFDFWAYKAENEETAQAVIDFIRDVIDFELAEQLIIEPAETEEGRS